MDNNKNKICILIIIVLAVAFVAMYFAFSKNEGWKTNEFMKKTEAYNQRIEAEKAEKANSEARNEKLLAETPGTLHGGDGFTYGTCGNGINYPTELENILKKNSYPYPVANLGVQGEDSLTVLGRTGAIPFVVAEDFRIEGTVDDLIPIKITSENGETVNPCIQEHNPGFNPCNVAGVKCIIYAEVLNTDISKASAYYLSRQDNKTDKIDVAEGAKIITSGSTDYKNYINVIQLGDGGGFDDDELVEQLKSFVKSFGEYEKYVIIGKIGGSDEENEYLDQAMEDEFGSHYINVRKLLTQRKVEGVSYSDADINNMKSGIIPDCLKKEGYLNGMGYKALGNLVYDKLVSLNLIKK